MKKTFLETGKIVSTHGIRGEVRVQPWCDSPELLAQLDTLYFNQGKTKIKINNARPHKNIVILEIDGVETVEAAQQLRGKILYVHREDLHLEEGVYFIEDILGCTVVDFENPEFSYGEVVEVTGTGANDVYHIKTAEGKIVLIPAIAQVIKHTDIEAKRIKITPLEGLFDED